MDLHQGSYCFLKCTHKVPVPKNPFGWFHLSSGHNFRGSVWVSLISNAEGLQGTILGGWQEQAHCLLPKGAVLLLSQWN